jgi:protein-tyrosine phosphatase
MKVLFVCYANLCRSPLAETIAKKLFSGRIEAVSAGVDPAPGPPFEELLDVAKRFYGADISGHRPRHVLEAGPEKFDYIIALDSNVFMHLTRMPEIPHDKLFGWEIQDPAGYGVTTYEKVARSLEKEIEKFVEARERESVPDIAG